MFYQLYISYSLLFSLSTFNYFPLNILSLLQYDLVRGDRETGLRGKVAEKEKSLQETKSAAEAMTKTHAEQLELLAKRANDLEEAKGKEKSRADEAEHGVKVLQQTLEMAKINAAKSKVVLDNLSSENDTLKVEVQRLRDLRAEDQATLAQKIDEAEEVATDKTLYHVWSTNLGVLNLNFLREELEPTLARWKIRIEEEAEDTVTETVSSSDEDYEAESNDLKTARNRLAVLREVAHEIFQEVPPAEPEVPPADKPATEDAPPAKDDAQP